MRLLIKAAKIDFDAEKYPPDYLKESWTELVRHTI
jgi:hypothetical protein